VGKSKDQERQLYPRFTTAASAGLPRLQNPGHGRMVGARQNPAPAYAIHMSENGELQHRRCR